LVAPREGQELGSDAFRLETLLTGRPGPDFLAEFRDEVRFTQR
jgi:hypothetical protein